MFVLKFEIVIVFKLASSIPVLPIFIPIEVPPLFKPVRVTVLDEIILLVVAVPSVLLMPTMVVFAFVVHELFNVMLFSAISKVE